MRKSTYLRFRRILKITKEIVIIAGLILGVLQILKLV